MSPASVRGKSLSCWTTGPQPSFRLFCIPYAGGGVSVYHKWAESLPGCVQVCALQLPGRDSQIGVPPFRRVSKLVEWLIASLDSWLDLPFAIFGHSMGGLIAHELAAAFRDRGKPMPRHLFVSACRAPGRPVRRWPMHHLPEDAFLRELSARYEGIPDVILKDQGLLRLFLPLLRADLEMVETWRGPVCEKFDFPVTVFGGRADLEIRREDLEPWKERTQRVFDLHMIEGNHFFVNAARTEVLRVVAGHLTAYCEESGLR